jgi:hypothetical protein
VLVSWQAARLGFGADRLSCLFVVVDQADAFLAGWHPCGDEVAWDWSATARPSAATVGLELRHACGLPSSLRLEFDVERQREALQCLAETEALVVADAPWGRGGRMAAYSVDGESTRNAVLAARAGLRLVVATVN